VLRARSPKLNGAVERAQRAHTEEFYQVRSFSDWTVTVLNREAGGWKRIYNTVRLYQVLGTLCRRFEFLRATAAKPGLRRLTALRARAHRDQEIAEDEGHARLRDGTPISSLV
jgi:hypothetical protein